MPVFSHAIYMDTVGWIVAWHVSYMLASLACLLWDWLNQPASCTPWMSQRIRTWPVDCPARLVLLVCKLPGALGLGSREDVQGACVNVRRCSCRRRRMLPCCAWLGSGNKMPRACRWQACSKACTWTRRCCVHFCRCGISLSWQSGSHADTPIRVWCVGTTQLGG